MNKAGKKHRVKKNNNVSLSLVEDKLLKACISLLIKHPFFGNLATRLKKVNAEDWCETAATDGRHFYYNPSFIDSLTTRECEFLYAHEILHNAFEHMLRKQDRDHKLFNIACDYAVNQILVDEKIGKVINNSLLSTEYREKSAEEIYDVLYQNALKIDIDQLSEMVLDDHLHEEGIGENEQDGDDASGDESNKKGKNRPKISKSERDKIRTELKEALLDAVQSAGAGNVPAGIARLVSALTAPKMDWRQLIKQQIQSTIKSDYTFLRPSKKVCNTQFRLPALKKEDTIDICIAIDASGSIDQKMLSEFLSEIQGIMEQYTDYKITVWSFDTKVYNIQRFAAADSSNISEYKVSGGGGTDFVCNFEYLKSEQIIPNCFLIFTDGYPCASWGDEHYCETIFCIAGMNKMTAPFGVTVHLEK